MTCIPPSAIALNELSNCVLTHHENAFFDKALCLDITKRSDNETGKLCAVIFGRPWD